MDDLLRLSDELQSVFNFEMLDANSGFKYTPYGKFILGFSVNGSLRAGHLI